MHTHSHARRHAAPCGHPARLMGLVLLVLACLLLLAPPASAQGPFYPTDIPGPAGSGAFGKRVVLLANGNIVVADPDYSTPTAGSVGAVYLYDGDTLALISVLTGSQANDRVGGYACGQTCAAPITVLSNGHFLVSSSDWHGGRGALTWVNGATGLSGVVSAQNSLVGRAFSTDLVGGIVLALPNGNYVALSPLWGGGGWQPIGAVTFGNGATGTTGEVTSANSLVGGALNSRVGADIFLLSNGNFVVLSGNAGKGAITWGSAETGLPKGVLSATNSLVGSQGGDFIGSGYATYPGVVPLSNGNYVVVSPVWKNGSVPDAGAVTWANGSAPITGVVSSANSLVGTRPGDNVGIGGNGPGIVPLANGNFVVVSTAWDSPSAQNVGAVTWVNGATGRSGVVSALNSLVGTTSDDYVGYIPNCLDCSGITPLTNGNYVVSSPDWDNGSAYNAGAVTWVNGATGRTGAVSAANSLVGTAGGDGVGKLGTVALPNGNYLARSPGWGSGRGAVTWGSGATGITGVVSAANSLVGRYTSDWVGVVPDYQYRRPGVVVLANGNYVVASPYWGASTSGEPSARGAVTWGNGETGITGEVSAANSLVGSTANDKLGLLFEGGGYGPPTRQGVIPLSNGNYVVGGAQWDNGAITDAGIITVVNGATGRTGVVEATQGLVGSQNGDMIGYGGVTALTNGNFVVGSPLWDNGAIVDAGAVTRGNGTSGVSGRVSTANSLVGGFDYDQAGLDGAFALANGDYLVRSSIWNDVVAGKAEVGALTWGSGASGVTGLISAANSLVGSVDQDHVGRQAPIALSNGDYLAYTPEWDNGAASDAGAVTWGRSGAGVRGAISAANSVVGTTAGQGATLNFVMASTNTRLVVGRDRDTIVTVVELSPRLAVQKQGTGSGAVTSAPAGIACGDVCSATFDPGAVVVLSATPAAGSTFSGWGGACVGTDTCAVTMNAASQVQAMFDLAAIPEHNLYLPVIQR